MFYVAARWIHPFTALGFQANTYKTYAAIKKVPLFW